MPEDGTAVTEILHFYEERADRIAVGGSISLVSIAMFVVFAAALRQAVVESGGADYLATAAFGGALLAMAAGLGAESINLVAALRAGEGELTRPLAQSLFEVSQILGSAAGGVGLGVFGLAIGWASLQSNALLPRWVGITVAAVGVVLLTPLAHVNVLSGGAMVLLGLLIGGALLRGAKARVQG
ncbi:MAG: hypothetical protein M3N53_05350 [Actinomycetota bacterium]|nr:hypothetical protein [Actinomycetota bacterium]